MVLSSARQRDHVSLPRAWGGNAAAGPGLSRPVGGTGCTRLVVPDAGGQPSGPLLEPLAGRPLTVSPIQLRPKSMCCAKRACLCSAPPPYEFALKTPRWSLTSEGNGRPRPCTDAWVSAQTPICKQVRVTTVAAGAVRGCLSGSLLAMPEDKLPIPAPAQAVPNCEPSSVVKTDAKCVEADAEQEARKDREAMEAACGVVTLVKEEMGISDGAPVAMLEGRRHSIKLKCPIKFTTPKKERMRRLEAHSFNKYNAKRTFINDEARRRRFEAIPPDEVAPLCVAFNRCDHDRHGALDQRGVIQCLREYGICGMNGQECRLIQDIVGEMTLAAPVRQSHRRCRQPSIIQAERPEVHGCADIMFLALEVIPAVRQRLITLRSRELLSTFQNFCGFDSQRIATSVCCDALRTLGIDSAILVSECRRSVVVEAPSVVEALNDPKATNSRRRGAILLPTEACRNMPARDVTPIPTVETQIGLDFESFQEMVFKARECTDRKIRNRERVVKDHNGVCDFMFEEFREDFLALYAIFKNYDVDDPPDLEDIRLALHEFGVSASCLSERQMINDTLYKFDEENGGEFSFCNFLDVVSEVRAYLQVKKREEHLKHFERCDADKSGQLCFSEIFVLLGIVGILPRNRVEQDELAYIIHRVDVDGSGLIDFQEFQLLCQRIDERMKRMRYEEEIDLGLSLGFTQKQLRELRIAFEMLDTNCSGTLEEFELRSALKHLQGPLASEFFVPACARLAEDGLDSHLDFLAFIELMRDLPDSDETAHSAVGKSLSNDHGVIPKIADMLHPRVAKRTLEYLRFSTMYLIALTQEEIIELFCRTFRIKRDADLRQALGVRTVVELFKAAQKLDEDLLKEAKAGGTRWSGAM